MGWASIDWLAAIVDAISVSVIIAVVLLLAIGWRVLFK